MTEPPDADQEFAAVGEFDPFARRAVIELTWTDHPARRHPWSLAFLAAALLTVGVGVAELLGGRWWGVGAVAVGAVLFRGFLLPTTYALDDAGAESRTALGTHQLAWGEVTRFRHDPAGGTLGTAPRPGLRDRLTGLRMTFAHSANRREAVRFVLSRLPPGVRVTAEEE